MIGQDWEEIVGEQSRDGPLSGAPRVERLRPPCRRDQGEKKQQVGREERAEGMRPYDKAQTKSGATGSVTLEVRIEKRKKGEQPTKFLSEP